jgi:hypothetical protein
MNKLPLDFYSLFLCCMRKLKKKAFHIPVILYDGIVYLESQFFSMASNFSDLLQQKKRIVNCP